MPQVSSSTTEPTSSFMVRGITTGEGGIQQHHREAQGGIAPDSCPPT